MPRLEDSRLVKIVPFCLERFDDLLPTNQGFQIDSVKMAKFGRIGRNRLGECTVFYALLTFFVLIPLPNVDIDKE